MSGGPAGLLADWAYTGATVASASARATMALKILRMTVFAQLGFRLVRLNRGQLRRV
jgi:hypothetical protein